MHWSVLSAVAVRIYAPLHDLCFNQFKLQKKKLSKQESKMHKLTIIKNLAGKLIRGLWRVFNE